MQLFELGTGNRRRGPVHGACGRRSLGKRDYVPDTVPTDQNGDKSVETDRQAGMRRRARK